MDFLDELRSAEEQLGRAERDFLTGQDGVSEALLVALSAGAFSADAKMAREQMLKLDESRYVKWDRWDRRYKFSASFWKDEGYPSIDALTSRANKPDWYSQRTGTTMFVQELMAPREIVAPTIDGEDNGMPTPLGNPANIWLLDFVALSSLRLSFKQHWERLVRDIVMRRARTDLRLVAERLGLTTHDVIAIAQKVRDLDDRVIEYDVNDANKNLTYLCRSPDPSITPLIDIVP